MELELMEGQEEVLVEMPEVFPEGLGHRGMAEEVLLEMYGLLAQAAVALANQEGMDLLLVQVLMGPPEEKEVMEDLLLLQELQLFMPVVVEVLLLAQLLLVLAVVAVEVLAAGKMVELLELMDLVLAAEEEEAELEEKEVLV